MMFYIISLLASMRPLWGYVLNYVFCLAFVASVPRFIRVVFDT